MKIRNEEGIMTPTENQIAKDQALQQLKQDVPSKDTIASLRADMEAMKIFLGIKGGGTNG
jgi:hypothetical protein